MSSNSPNESAPIKVLVNHDYDKMIGEPMHIIPSCRRIIKDNVEKPEITQSDGIECFDMSRYIKELEKTQNIYFTDESDEIIGLLCKLPCEVKRKVYGKIGETLCDEYLRAPKGDFEETMSDLALGITEIELVTRKGILAGIRLVSEYEGTEEEEEEEDDDKIESDKEENLPN